MADAHTSCTEASGRGSSARNLADLRTGSSINIKGTDVPECNATTANTLQDNRYYVDTVTKPTPVCPPGVALERGSETLPLPSNDAIMKLARAALDM